MTQSGAITRFPTGVPGLDHLIEGGLIEGSAYIIDGPPGAGKTLMALQMCFACAARGQRASFMTLLAESHDRLAMHLSRMTFFDPKVVPNRVSLVSAFKTLEKEGLDALLGVVRKEVLSREVKLMVLDGFSSVDELAPAGTHVRKFVHALQAMAASTRCTVLLLNSVENEPVVRPERTMVDGILELSDELVGLRPRRHLRISKLRGTDAVRGRHTVEITDDGLTVYQRFETRTMKRAPTKPVASGPRDGRFAFGVPGLDSMLHGGVTDRSVTMLLGPTGSGKTVLGLQFLGAGAAIGEPGLYFGFYEQPDDLAHKAERVGIEVAAYQARELLTLEWHRSPEASIDIVGDRLMRSIERTKARRVYLDGMQTFQHAIESPERIGDVLATMVEELHRRGIVMVYSVETPELFGHDVSIPLDSASQITNNIIVLRRLQIGAHSRRLISVLKMRDSIFDASQREFEITDQGFIIAASPDGAHEVLADDPRPRPAT